MAVSIRRLHAADVSALQEIRLASLVEFPASFGSSPEEESRRAELGAEQLVDSPGKTAFILGAFDGASLVGICRFTQEERTKTRHRGNIQAMYVRPAYVGQGIGRRLLQRTLEEAFNNPVIELIMLGVVAGNAAAGRLYEQVGFTEYGSLPNYLLVDGHYYTMRFMALKRPITSSKPA